MTDSLSPFHIAVEVRDLNEARRFYGGLLALPEGRCSEHWIDYNMFGHQYVVHLNRALGASGRVPHVNSTVDSQGVPIPHCGVVLPMEQWQDLADRLCGNVDFVLEPQIRFRGQPGEQGTLFFHDPSGNALEFKGMHNTADLFKS